jgi:hypothetical protein
MDEISMDFMRRIDRHDNGKGENTMGHTADYLEEQAIVSDVSENGGMWNRFQDISK